MIVHISFDTLLGGQYRIGIRCKVVFVQKPVDPHTAGKFQSVGVKGHSGDCIFRIIIKSSYLKNNLRICVQIRISGIILTHRCNNQILICWNYSISGPFTNVKTVTILCKVKIIWVFRPVTFGYKYSSCIIACVIFIHTPEHCKFLIRTRRRVWKLYRINVGIFRG